ncbi:MAG: sugar ABC transporter substrate-binding protein [Nitrososphaeria archaeon]
MTTINKRNKAVSTLAIAVIIIIIIAAIGGAYYYYSTTTSSHKKIVIYELISMVANSYFGLMINGSKLAVSQLQAHGINVQLVVLDADNTLSTQISQIQEAIAAGANAILINPVSSSGVVPYLAKAESQGITVITLDRDTSNTSVRLCYVGSNNTLLGIMDAKAFVSFLRESGKPTPWNVVFIEGPPSTGVGLIRNNAIMSVLQPFIQNGTIKLVSEQNGQFLNTVTYSIMQSIIASTGGKIDGVITANGLEAEGAGQALMAAGIPIGLPNGVIVSAIDFTPDVMQALQNGEIVSTAGQSPFIMGYWGVYIAYYHITKGWNPPSVIITPSMLVTKNNIQQALSTLQSAVPLSNVVPNAPPVPIS